MKCLDANETEIAKRLIISVLSPINATVTGFLTPYSIKHRSKQGDEPWREWVEQWHPVAIHSDLGEGFVYLSSSYDLTSAVWVGCRDFSISNGVDETTQSKICAKLYAPEFLEIQR